MTALQLTQTIRRAAGLNPEGLATIDGDQVRTHAEFLAGVATAAGALRSLGVGPGDRVSALAMNSHHFLEHYMACWWLGAIPAPLNIRWTAEEAGAALSLVGSKVLIVDSTFAPQVQAIRRHAPCVEQVVGWGRVDLVGVQEWASLIRDAESVPDGGFGGDDSAALLFTGGTTGIPKAVELTHQNLLVAGIGMRAMGCATGDRLLHAPPLFHMGGLQMALSHWLGGGTHILIPGFDPLRVADAVERHRVTDVLLAPTMIEMFLATPGLANRDLKSLRQVFYGTSPMTPRLLQRAMDVIPTTAFVQGYGMTETALTIMLSARYHEPDQRDSGKLNTIGEPSPFAEVRIVDQAGNPCPVNTPGELLVRGPSVMKGYWRDETRTREVLDEDGWLHTGDGAMLYEDGFVQLTDRIKDMIITGGENVFSVEVERTIAQHPKVASVAVVGLPHEVWIEAVHAVVVPVASEVVTAEDVIAFARETLAAFKVPRSVQLVEQLPLSAAGKVLKTNVREIARRWMAEQAVDHVPAGN